jgi:hypothetical protein
MTTQPNAPQPTLDPEAVWTHLNAALDRGTPLAIWTAMADIPVLLAELDRYRALLTLARTELANLLAAAQATLAAHHDGETDPLSYLRDQVAGLRADNTPWGTR